MTKTGRLQAIGTGLDCRLCDAPARSARADGSDAGRWPAGVWLTPAVVAWSQLLLDAARHWTGRDIIHRDGSPEEQAGSLFFSPSVVVSHGTEPDPILNYGNRAALELWDTDWQQFTRTPSRLSAEPVNRPERERMLERVTSQGFVADYRGVRIAMTGRRFLVEDAMVWTLLDRDGVRRGQAAMFSRWRYL